VSLTFHPDPTLARSALRQAEAAIAAERQRVAQHQAQLEAIDRVKRAAEAADKARRDKEDARLSATGFSAHDRNIAVVGTTGAGKSTLVNSLRGLLATDPGAAAARAGFETTEWCARYPHPADRSLVLWDMPGGDTDAFPAATYFEDRCLHRFDCLVMVYAGRFTAACEQIMKKGAAHRKSLIIVCTLTDEKVCVCLCVRTGAYVAAPAEPRSGATHRARGTRAYVHHFWGSPSRH
jgi:energy-coupling factor transporter ATP-binding protein EcfA2